MLEKCFSSLARSEIALEKCFSCLTRLQACPRKSFSCVVWCQTSFNWHQSTQNGTEKLAMSDEGVETSGCGLRRISLKCYAPLFFV